MKPWKEIHCAIYFFNSTLKKKEACLLAHVQALCGLWKKPIEKELLAVHTYLLWAPIV